MARPRIFISSTFYDLRQVRADLDLFIETLGYEPVRNEEGDIPYGKEEALEEYCYKEIRNIDILVCIIGGRFGTESKRSKSSVTQLELKAAINESKQVYIFVEKNVLSEFETFLINKSSDVKYRYVDDRRVYEFLEEVKALSANNTTKGFETAADITKFLREQFGGLFQRFLEEQTRIKEVSLIRGLENTAVTLNKLVNYLSDQNKDHAGEINRILMINHPLVEYLKKLLEIPYNFYIEGIEDTKHLIKARGFMFMEELPFDDEQPHYEWQRDANRKINKLFIDKSIFESDGKLKFFRRTDWKDSFARMITQEKQTENDDLPF